MWKSRRRDSHKPTPFIDDELGEDGYTLTYQTPETVQPTGSTSLTGRSVLTKSFESKHIRIAFRPTDETFEVTDAAIEQDPEFIADVTVLWAKGYKSTVRNFMARLGSSRDAEFDHSEQDQLEERIDRVRDLRDFRFQVIELNASANEEQVAEIFVRTNSKGVTLNQADFILTLMSVHWEKGRLQLEAFCRDAVDPKIRRPSPRNAFLDPRPDQVLRAGVGLAFCQATSSLTH